MTQTTADAVRDLIAQGYATRNIAVLSFRGQGSSRLLSPGAPTRLSGHPTRRQRGYDPEGNAVWSEGDLLVDTVFRFKGQAADAVIITEIDFEQFGNRERRRLFVALSRARLQAVLITTARAAEILQGRLTASPLGYQGA
jgi:hypothetical protein